MPRIVLTISRYPTVRSARCVWSVCDRSEGVASRRHVTDPTGNYYRCVYEQDEDDDGDDDGDYLP